MKSSEIEKSLAGKTISTFGSVIVNGVIGYLILISAGATIEGYLIVLMVGSVITLTIQRYFK